MIAFNITIKVDPGVEAEWLAWQKNEHIPGMMATGIFTDHKLYKLLGQDETEGTTWVNQYFIASFDHYKKYVAEFETEFTKKSREKFKDRIVEFQTVMEIVN